MKVKLYAVVLYDTGGDEVTVSGDPLEQAKKVFGYADETLATRIDQDSLDIPMSEKPDLVEKHPVDSVALLERWWGDNSLWGSFNSRWEFVVQEIEIEEGGR